MFGINSSAWITLEVREWSLGMPGFARFDEELAPNRWDIDIDIRDGRGWRAAQADAQEGITGEAREGGADEVEVRPRGLDGCRGPSMHYIVD